MEWTGRTPGSGRDCLTRPAAAFPSGCPLCWCPARAIALCREGEEVLHVGRIPAGTLARGSHPDPALWVLLDQRQPQLPQHRQVFLRIAHPHPALVFPKAHVQHPVQPVLDPPMAPHCSRHLPGIARQATQVVPHRRRGGLPGYLPGRRDPGNTPQAHPAASRVQPGDHRADAPLQPPMVLLHGPDVVVRDIHDREQSWTSSNVSSSFAFSANT